jgi:alkylhydroperoxidase family enzyme
MAEMMAGKRQCHAIKIVDSVRASRRVVVAEDLFRVLRWKHVDGIRGPRAVVMLAFHIRRRIEMDLPNVRLPRSSEPPSGAKQTDEGRHADSVVHVARLDRLHGGEEQDHTNEDDP